MGRFTAVDRSFRIAQVGSLTFTMSESDEWRQSIGDFLDWPANQGITAGGRVVWEMRTDTAAAESCPAC